MLKKFSVQASHYTIASALSALAGTISFPFLTRMLTVGEYGLMSLVSTTLDLLIGFSKLGTQHAIVRFHGEADTGRGPTDLRGFYSTAVLTMAGAGIVTTASWMLIGPRLAATWLEDPRLPKLFLMTAVLVAVRVLESGLANLMRAEQRTKPLMAYRVVRRYFILGATVLALLLVARSVFVFYAALIVAEVLLLAGLSFYIFGVLRRPAPSLGGFSPELLRRMAAYGVPMMLGYELAGVILNVGDRYVLEALLGSEPLGLYSAAYNMCEALRGVFILPFGLALMPIYMRMWVKEGPEQTRTFLSESLRQYALLTTPVIAGLSAVGGNLLPFLASDKHSGGVVVLPSVIAGMVFAEATAFTGAGLFLYRKTVTIMALVMSAAALNVGMNLVLIPRIGILGAAIATLVSYGALLVVMTVLGRRHVEVAIPWRALAQAGVAGLGMYLVVGQIDAGSRVLTLAAQVTAGALFYALAMVAVDPQVRELARRILGWMRARSGRS